MAICRNPGTFITMLLLSTVASGRQSVLYTFHGDSAEDQLAYSAECAGDVNGDGLLDLIVGAPFDDNNGIDAGSARIYSGMDGSILFSLDGGAAGDWFGVAVTRAGDINLDGFEDVLIGSIRANADTGTAVVFSGKTGSWLQSFWGDSPGDWFGFSTSCAGDLDADGFEDLLIGAVLDDNTGTNSGSVRAISGKDWTTLYTLDGDSKGDLFGYSTAGVGDVNGDGHADFAVGAPNDDDNGANSGSARVFSGKNGSILYTLHGEESGEWFGNSVSAVGDLNGDGHNEIAVGAPNAAGGAVRVFSGLDGTALLSIAGDAVDDVFGWSVSAAGDVDGDGIPDLLVGAIGSDHTGSESGSALVFSGKDATVIHTLHGESSGDMCGFSVSAMGDIDGDGLGDLVVASPQSDANGANSGSVRVFAGCQGLGTKYCGPANLNSTGVSAQVRSCGSENTEAGFLFLHASAMPANQFGYFLTSQMQGFTPFVGGSQGNLCLGGSIGRFRAQIQSSGTVGHFSIAVDLTQIPMGPPVSVMAGETWNFQAWFRDLNPTPTSNFTDAVSVLFQ